MPFSARVARLSARVARRLGIFAGLGAAGIISSPAMAACIFAPTAGPDAHICDSGTAPGLTDLSGDNTLTFPAGGTGVINGTVTFGSGADRIVMHSGRVTGAVVQGMGIDAFEMSGGEILSLQQGDGYDTFLMTGGTILGAFEDGDFAEMTGGTIGRVDMKLADNFFYLRDGRIHSNLVTGFGLDTIEISGGSVGGNISVSGGDDIIRLSGGSVGGEIRTSFGNDRLEWNGGGAVFDSVLMGQDADIATLRNLSESILSVTPRIDGGVGTDARILTPAIDVLVFDGTFAENGARYTNWETITFTNGSSFSLDGRALVLGGADTLGGSVAIDATSSMLIEGNAAISPFGAGLASLANAGTIYMGAASTAPVDRLTVTGNYQGLNGSIVLDTYLGADGSASDRLVVSGGAITGLTGLGVVNAGGPGAATTQSGILVVEAINGATSAGGAFALDRAVAAGAFEYLLFQGGVEAGTQDNWYLRSSLITAPVPVVPPPEPPAPPPPPPVAPVEPVPVEPPPGPPVDPGVPDPEVVAPTVPVDPPVAPPVAPQPIDPDPTFGNGATTPTPLVPWIVDPTDPTRFAVVAPTGQARLPDASLLAPGAAIPLYRLEAATYAVVPLAAMALGLETLGTLDERRGSQGFVADIDEPGWLRVYGQVSELGWSGTVAPVFDGHSYGIQGGFDLLRMVSSDGATTVGGVLVGTAGMTGDVRGFALGWDNYDVGRLNLSSTQLGLYATHTAANGWYLDGVVMASLFGGTATSTRGVGIGIGGLGLTASLEAGLPIALEGGWRLEPQGQIIWQSLALDSGRDGFSDVRFADSSGVTGRLGLRLERETALENGSVTPAVFANLWQDFGTTETMLDADSLRATRDGTALELGAGFAAELGNGISIFGNASYTFGLGQEEHGAAKAMLGLQAAF